ncbi:phosphotransferase [Pseudactinotalea suaedae]|uniref:phosphotransferase n=1 Tax=Pseudactinotalea suaedae TaxID=1524924 RepID=UPI0019D67EFF|nr:phosphotransferase [Pseudactinotalea suaedae]
MQILAGGRDADVFGYGDGLVLRRYRDGRSAEAEGVLMRDLARLGFPVPAVESVTGPDLVMERIDGPTMATQLLQGDLDPVEGGALLARLHDDLHRLPWPGGQPLLHLDLHPFNVLMSSRGPVVIDWPNARTGAPGLDVAMTALILAQVATYPEIVADSALGSAPSDDVTARLPEQLTALLASFARSTATPFAPHLDDVEELRRSDRYQSEAERARLGDAVALVRSLAIG